MLDLDLPYVNHHADQLIGLLDGIVVDNPQWPPSPLRAYVCAAEYPDGDRSQAMTSELDFNRHNLSLDAVTRTWVLVPVGRILEQHPMARVADLSPLTREKVPA